MSDSTLVIWDEILTAYDHGPGHPLRPVRLDLTVALARSLGVLQRPGVTIAPPESAADDVLELVHDPDYVAFVKTAPDELMSRLASRYGFGNGDNPVFTRMHETSALVTGASVQAAAAVWQGRTQHAVNLSGGLHHAMRARASGFCVYDDPAVAIAWLLAAGAQRVAYVDVDVHHGDGVQSAFYGDPRVLTVSLHESGRTLFPGTGWADEIGTGEGTGYAANVALPAGTDDGRWLRAYDAVVPHLLRAYRPQVIVSQLGCDTHRLDPLAHLTCTVNGQRAAYARMHKLAHELCEGRWVVLGGGGYDPLTVVPRAWTHALAEVTGDQVDGLVPEEWRDYASHRLGGSPPELLHDGPNGAAPAARPWSGPDGGGLDRAIQATRDAVFSFHGLVA
ncbi:MAG TPA: acetoin utilization protein AcuC [Frankiaceae bacterium]|nr:acetoin utilization protein AcuC [Frankiaceae bacterium]